MSKKSTLSTTALKTLTTMALALPGIQTARSETAIIKPQTDLRYTRYDEGKLHYQIDAYQAQLAFAIAPQMDVSVKANQDIMTGASTIVYGPQVLEIPGGSANALSAIRTGTSIVDKRSAGDFNVRYFGEDYNVGIGAGISEENFYESQTVHIELANEFNKSNTEVVAGYSASNDSIRATINSDTAFYPLQRPNMRKGKVTQRVHLDMKQDLSTTSLAQASVEFIADKGYLDDPYKDVGVYGDPQRSNEFSVQPGLGSPFAVPITFFPDTRPDYKASLATSFRFIQYITPLNSSLHLGFRFAKNTWNIKSYTFNVDYNQELGDSWQVVPSVRYYTQNEAYFYAMWFDAIGTSPIPSKPIGAIGPASSDYRLGRFGSISGELKFHYKFMDDQSGKLTIVAGCVNRRNQFYWGRKPYPFNPDNDFKTYYGSLGVSFVF